MTCKSGLVTRTLFGTAILVGCVFVYFLSAAPALKVNDRLTTGDWRYLGEEQFPTWRRFYQPVVWTMRSSPLRRPLTAWSTLWVSPYTLELALEPAESFGGTISEFNTVISCSFGTDDVSSAPEWSGDGCVIRAKVGGETPEPFPDMIKDLEELRPIHPLRASDQARE